MEIKFKKLTAEAVAPKQGKPGDAGFDLTAIEVETIAPGLVCYRTGIAVEIPRGFVGLVFPRSSVYRTGQILTNCVGVIDSGYRGEITAVFRTVDNGELYCSGERCVQLVIVQIPEVEYIEAEELSASERGTGGYGSTGR